MVRSVFIVALLLTLCAGCKRPPRVYPNVGNITVGDPLLAKERVQTKVQQATTTKGWFVSFQSTEPTTFQNKHAIERVIFVAPEGATLRVYCVHPSAEGYYFDVWVPVGKERVEASKDKQSTQIKLTLPKDMWFEEQTYLRVNLVSFGDILYYAKKTIAVPPDTRRIAQED